MKKNTFRFKNFTIINHPEVMKVGTDGVLAGALANFETAKRILDVGTGTGLIALMLAQRFSAEIVAIDINGVAVETAKLNVQNSIWKNRIEVFHSSIQNFNVLEKFDAIISNPPFYDENFKPPNNSRKIARHDDTLKPTELLACSYNILVDNGILSVIYPTHQAELFIEKAIKYRFYLARIVEIFPNPKSICVRKFITLSKIPPKKQNIETLIIENGNHRHDYTEQYKLLTKDFYLAF